jgi:hypothetical protein
VPPAGPHVGLPAAPQVTHNTHSHGTHAHESAARRMTTPWGDLVCQRQVWGREHGVHATRQAPGAHLQACHVLCDGPGEAGDRLREPQGKRERL